MVASRRVLRGLLAWVAAVWVGLAIAPVASSAVPSRPAARAAACTPEVKFGLVDATGCLNAVSTDQWTSTATVNLSGVPLTPAPGTQFVLSAPSASSPGGKLSVNASITIAGVTFEKPGLLNWNLPSGRKGRREERRLYPLRQRREAVRLCHLGFGGDQNRVGFHQREPATVRVQGGAGIHIGPTTSGVSPITINGSPQYTDSRPWVLEARGNVLVFGRQVAEAFLRYRSDNTIGFGFHVNLDFKVASIEGGVVGWIEARTPVRFNVDGSGRVCP